jgi:hypothetical protein
MNDKQQELFDYLSNELGVEALLTQMQEIIKIASKQEEPNPVNHPQHYGGGDNVYEAIKVIEAWELGFNLGNTVKYIARCGKKDDELQELKKARWYLEREIAKLENALGGLCKTHT